MCRRRKGFSPSSRTHKLNAIQGGARSHENDKFKNRCLPASSWGKNELRCRAVSDDFLDARYGPSRAPQLLSKHTRHPVVPCFGLACTRQALTIPKAPTRLFLPEITRSFHQRWQSPTQTTVSTVRCTFLWKKHQHSHHQQISAAKGIAQIYQVSINPLVHENRR